MTSSNATPRPKLSALVLIGFHSCPYCRVKADATFLRETKLHASSNVWLIDHATKLPETDLLYPNIRNLVTPHKGCIVYHTEFPSITVPGAPQLRVSSATEDTLSLSWTLPVSSVVDSYDIRWEFHQTRLASTFRAALGPEIFNYTISGLGDYGDASLIVTVTAFNAAGNTTSPVLNVAANFVSITQDDGAYSCTSNEELIAGLVTGGCVTIAIIVGLFGLIVFCCKRKIYKKSSVNTNCGYDGTEAVVATNSIDTLANE